MEILKKYKVPATFFIIDYGEDPKKIELLKSAIAQGHTIGVHGYSHDYGEIYQSVPDFMENIKTLDIPENVTEIGPDAFYQCNPNLILCGKPGTYVQQYAIDNEIAFRVRSLLNTSRLSADSIALGQKVTVECSAKVLDTTPA